MIKKYHGKHYYVVLKNRKEKKFAIEFLKNSEYLKDEKFHIRRELNGFKVTYILYSEVSCGKLKYEKYSEWLNMKNKIYKMRKENN